MTEEQDPDSLRETRARDHERLRAEGGRHPTLDHPLNAEPRPNIGPLFAVLALIAVILLVFLVITVVRYTT